MNWESWIERQRESTLDLQGLDSSSALVAALVRVQVTQAQPLVLTNAPAGLYGLARVLGVEQRFNWELSDGTTD